MSKLYDLMTAENIKGYIEETQKNQTPLLGEALFPADKQIGLDLSYIKGRKGLPTVLKPSAFDAHAPIRDRIGVEKLLTEMPFFRERMTIKERERQQILQFLAGNQTNLANQIMRLVFDDAAQLVESASVTAELMRMQLLSTGKIQVQAEGAAYEYDYQLDADQFVTLTGQDKWSDPSSTPITDILEMKEQARRRTGVEPKRAILTSTTFGYIASNITIRKDLNPLGYENIILTKEDVLEYLSRKTRMQFAIYDNMYTGLDGTAKTYFPDGVVTFLPEGTLGKTWYGTTPEEADLMTGNNEADVRIVNTGVAVTTRKLTHPVQVETIVSEIVLPSFEAADYILIAKVA